MGRGSGGASGGAEAEHHYYFAGRCLHSSTLQLNVSAYNGIGGARRGCVARVQVVFRVFRVFFVSDTAQVELRSGRV